VVTGEALVGDVAGRVAVIVDDLVTTGTTLARAGEACRARGAVAVLAVATHGVFAEDAARVLAAAGFERLIVTDSVSPGRLPAGPARDRVEVVGVAPLVGEAIRRIHEGGSLGELFEVGG
jgi:ribose-phosphate pyrophosphokinase